MNYECPRHREKTGTIYDVLHVTILHVIRYFSGLYHMWAIGTVLSLSISTYLHSVDITYQGVGKFLNRKCEL